MINRDLFYLGKGSVILKCFIFYNHKRLFKQSRDTYLYLQQKINDLETDDPGEIENADEVEVEELVVRLLEDGPVGSAMSGEFDEPLDD